MVRRIAEYTVREGAAEAVTEAIARFVAEVRAREPATTYEAYRRGDSRSFIHLMAFESPEAEEAHRRAPYTAEFVEVLYPRCTEEPRFTELREVGTGS